LSGDHLTAYLPVDRRQALLLGTTLPDRADGAVLFADLSGFVALTTALAQAFGRERGVEELNQRLDEIYGALIEQAHRYGGSVIAFSGDALTCWFDDRFARECVGAAGATLRAIGCGVGMQTVMEQFGRLHPTPGCSLALKVAVAAGRVRRFLVGDPAVQTLEVIAGSTMDRVAAAENLANPGEVVITSPAEQAAARGVGITEWRTTVDGERCAVVANHGVSVAATPWPERCAADEAQLAAQARPWLLPAVYERLRRGHHEFLAEQRPVVACFVRFAGLDYDNDDRAGERLDAYVRWVQSVVRRYDGALLSITMGDKGSYLQTVFGAPVAHADDPTRAVAAALDLLRQRPAELDFITDVQIGVARGAAYSGATGSPKRRAYVVIGEKVNLAARMMQAAAPGDLWCDHDTARAAESVCAFEPLPAVSLKGVSGTVTVYRPRLSESMLGRESELGELVAALQDLAVARRRVIILEGESGIGKTRLVDAFQQHVQRAGFTCLIGAGDGIETATPYHAWRLVFSQVFDLIEGSARDRHLLRQPLSLSAAQRDRVLRLLSQMAPELAPLAPLLNAVLPLDLPDNEMTTHMSGEVRGENVQKLLVGLLAASAPRSGLVFILEDGHWVDATSWALLRRVLREVAPLLVVVTTHPLGDAITPEFQAVRVAPETAVRPVAALPPAIIEKLVCQRLGARSLPGPVARLLRSRAEGNPLFGEELAYALRDSGLVRIVNGACELTEPETRLAAVDVPDTVKGLITSRIDRLPPEQQLALKAASVIGRVFRLDVLRDIFPVPDEANELEARLDTLTRLEITSIVSRAPEPTYMFKHGITHEAAYQLMTFAQRRQLHRAAAEWYEREGNEHELESSYALLGHHWRRAEVLDKAIAYTEMAGARALKQSAYPEAVHFFTDLFELDDQDRGAGASGGDGDRDRLASRRRWTVRLAQAHLDWGRFRKCREYIGRAAELYGEPLPERGVALVVAVLGELLRQARHRIRTPAPAGSHTLLERGHLYSALAQVAYFANQKGLSLYGVTRSLNLREHAGAPVELAVSYGAFGLLVSIFRLYALAEFYLRRGLQLAQQANQPPIIADVLRVTGLSRVARGQWQQYDEALTRARAIHEHFGDWRHWGDCTSGLAHAAFLRGDFERSVTLTDELRASAQRTGIRIHQFWADTVGGLSAVRLGRIDAAESVLSANLQALAEEPEPNSELASRAFLATIRWRRGDDAGAQAAAAVTLERLEAAAGAPGTYNIIDGYSALTDVYLELWESAGVSDAAARDLRRVVSQLCRRLAQHARPFPIGEPSTALHRGRYEWMRGRTTRAQRCWRRSLAAAERLQMRYDRALAHYQIGRHLPPRDSQRRTHLTRARELFEELRTPYELARTCRALES
jgi:class 3 adenylate cyclase/tetratricopeptide (TPR) repeat protein